ncbi:MAG: hypothetical protein HOE90_01025 [Bacteriovoracaceae bacterium]|nr:hypothetical protein [Bacteriovoracaceae bacterium]
MKAIILLLLLSMSSNLFALASVESDCADQNHIKEAIKQVFKKYGDFAGYQKNHGYKIPKTLMDCLKGKLKNGRVKCRANTNPRCITGALGFATAGSKNANICKRTEDVLSDCDQIDKRGSYAMLTMHEWTHACGYIPESQPENVEEAVMDWWNSTHTGFSTNCAQR